MFRRWRITGLMAAAIVLAAIALASGSTSSVRTFYLNVKVGQCALPFSSKTITVVPCSNPRHVMEFYAVGHAGWGHQAMPPPALAYAKARVICLADIRHITHHALPKNRAWWAFWPDAGREQARYGDKLICGFRTWPKLSPLGRGWHVR
jgi:hypothetical protein